MALSNTAPPFVPRHRSFMAQNLNRFNENKSTVSESFDSEKELKFEYEIIFKHDGFILRRKNTRSRRRRGNRRRYEHIQEDSIEYACSLPIPNYTYDVPPEALFVIVNPFELPSSFVPLLEVCHFMERGIKVNAFMIPLPTLMITTKENINLNRVVRRGKYEQINYSASKILRYSFAAEVVSREEAKAAVVECFRYFISPRWAVPYVASKTEAVEYLAKYYGITRDVRFILVLGVDGVPTYWRLNPECDDKFEFDLDPTLDIRPPFLYYPY